MTPDLVPYSTSFQEQAARELQAMKPPCARDVPGDFCSAAHRLVIDYGDTRSKIRAIRQ